jgi:hypothetical protein
MTTWEMAYCCVALIEAGVFHHRSEEGSQGAGLRPAPEHLLDLVANDEPVTLVDSVCALARWPRRQGHRAPPTQALARAESRS